MIKSLAISVSLSLLLSAACAAAEPSMCVSLCAAEKRECRAQAVHKTKIDTAGAFAEMRDRHPDASTLGKLQGTPQGARAAVQDESRKRNAERAQACDSTAKTCSKACAAPQATPSDVLVTPKPQH